MIFSVGKTKTITIPSDADVKRVTVVEFVNGTSAMDTTRNSSPVILDLADAKKNLKARAKAPEAIATQSFNSTATSTTQSLSSTGEPFPSNSS